MSQSNQNHTLPASEEQLRLERFLTEGEGYGELMKEQDLGQTALTQSSKEQTTSNPYFLCPVVLGTPE